MGRCFARDQGVQPDNQVKRRQLPATAGVAVVAQLVGAWATVSVAGAGLVRAMTTPARMTAVRMGKERSVFFIWQWVLPRKT